MGVKKVLYKIIPQPLLQSFSIVEWLLKFLIKINAIVAWLLINVLLICMFIAICTRQWTSLGILAICMVFTLVFLYGQTTMLYLISEARVYIKM